jgi:TnpA family transposase
MSKTIYIGIYFVHVSNAYSTVLSNTINGNKSHASFLFQFLRKKRKTLNVRENRRDNQEW